MALIEEVAERLGGGGAVGVGVAGLLLAPVVARPAGRVLRALAKGAIKGWLILSAKTVETAQTLKTGGSDLLAEAHEEVAPILNVPREGAEAAA